MNNLPYISYLKQGYTLIAKVECYKEFPEEVYNYLSPTLPGRLLENIGKAKAFEPPFLVYPYESIWYDAVNICLEYLGAFNENGTPNYMLVLKEWCGLCRQRLGFIPELKYIRRFLEAQTKKANSYVECINKANGKAYGKLSKVERLYDDIIDFELSFSDKKLSEENQTLSGSAFTSALKNAKNINAISALMPMPEFVYKTPFKDLWFVALEKLSSKKMTNLVVKSSGVARPNYKVVVSLWKDLIKKDAGFRPQSGGKGKFAGASIADNVKAWVFEKHKQLMKKLPAGADVMTIDDAYAKKHKLTSKDIKTVELLKKYMATGNMIQKPKQK